LEKIKKRNLKNSEIDDSFGSLGTKYWQNFCRRNAAIIRQKTQYSLLNPEYLVMVDEVGENISQKGDGNAGRQNFMVANDMRAQVRNSFKDNHFTVLGFTAANGHPSMCAIIIIAESKLKVTDVTGYNPLSSDGQDICGEEMKVLEEEIHAMKDEHSNGADRMLPFRPTCTLNAAEVPTFVTCSKNGSISVNYLSIFCPRWTTIVCLTAAMGPIPFCYSTGMAAGSRNRCWNTPWSPIGLGLVALEFLWHVHVAARRQCRAEWDIQD
jgi:hypothetical protein